MFDLSLQPLAVKTYAKGLVSHSSTVVPAQIQKKVDFNQVSTRDGCLLWERRPASKVDFLRPIGLVSIVK